MNIVTVQFNYPNRSDYRLLLDVFKYSVRKNMPEVRLISYCIEAPEPLQGRALNYKYNTVKLEKWVNFLENTNDNTIFADCDMIMLRPARHAFDKKFDIAYTERTRIKRIPMNGGVMMARPTQKARQFFREMLEINKRMLQNEAFHKVWNRKYAGMNQSAFGYCLENSKCGAKIYKYKTIEWNAVDCDWSNIDNKTVFLHCKSKLRKMVLGEKPYTGKYKKAVTLWRNMRLQMIRERKSN